jgi:transglutaminase-like putative cysteine protease
MMSVERLLQIGMATLAFLGMLVLGMGQDDPKLPVLGAIAAISSVLLTDTLGWLRLRGASANIAAIAAVVACGWDMSQRFGDDTRLLGLANVLAYLQIVLLYQPKIIRRYWLIAALSLLQVAVAAALNLEIAFGGLLLLYLLVAIASLTLLHVHTLYERHGEQGAGALRDSSGSSENSGADRVNAARDGVAGTFDRQRAPLASRRGQRSAEFAGPRLANPLSLVRHWSFGFELLRICAVTLVLTAIVFPIVPRVGSSTMRRAITATTTTTGFTETVKIGEAASISESPEAVMRVRFTDRAGATYLLQGEPMLRGSWLAEYHKGEWQAPTEGENALDRFQLRPPQLGAELVRQQITIEPLDSTVLFGVWPYFLDESNGTNDLLRYDRRSQRLLRPSSHRSDQLKYSTITTGFQSRQTLDVVPAFSHPGRGFLQFPEGSLPTLTELADRLVADVPRDDRVARARRLESHFRDGDYYYSLSSMPSDPSLDPVEDFMRNTHRGHCEYYATALTLMLRHVGIPARMVVGFKGGEWNHYGEFYLVRQLHAHAWVEAYIRHLPDDVPQQGANPDAGGWLRLDPTPGRSLAATVTSEGIAANMRQVADYVQYLWASYIVRLDSGIQIQEIYLPIKNAVMALFDPEFWQELYAEIAQFLRDGRFSWPAAAATFLIGVVGIALYRWVRFVFWLGVRVFRRHRPVGRAGAAPHVEFYRRFTTLMRRLGRRRVAQQTPLDFALDSQIWLTAQGAATTDAAVAVGIVEAYYRVRYGHRPLDSLERTEVEQALRQLERTVAEVKARRKV